jgi:peptidoglycan/LPS O-acetylase OafA/YrhL
VFVAAGMILLPWLGVRVDGLFLDGNWLMFAAGVLVYFATNYASARARLWLVAPLLFGTLCAVANPQQLRNPQVEEPDLSYLAAFSFALLILGLRRWDRQLTAAWVLWPLRYCGEMCYSLYLVHLPTVLVVTWLFNSIGLRHPLAILCGGTFCGVVTSVALARVFHIWVERRFLNASPIVMAGESAPASKAAGTAKAR